MRQDRDLRLVEILCLYCGRELQSDRDTNCGGCGAPLKKRQRQARAIYHYYADASGFEPYDDEFR